VHVFGVSEEGVYFGYAVAFDGSDELGVVVV